MRLTKILLCVHQFYPRFYTGTEALTLSVAEELKQRGYEVVVFTAEVHNPGESVPDFIASAFDKVFNRQAPVLQKDIYHGLPVWRLFMTLDQDPVRRIEREANATDLRPFFDTVLVEEQPDCRCTLSFHLMRLNPASTLVEAVRDHGIPVYFTATDFWLMCPTFQLIRQNDQLCSGPAVIDCFLCTVDLSIRKMGQMPLKFRLGRAFPRLAGWGNPGAGKVQRVLAERIRQHQHLIQMFDGVMWSNTFLRDMFHQNGFNARREEIIPFPVPERAKALFTLPPPSTRHRLKVSFIGTLHPSKGPHILVEALLKIDSAIPVELSIWGAETYPSFLNRLQTMAQGDARIRFLGTFPQEAFASVLEDVDVVVIPSLWYENTPLTALSVMAARRVLVASDLGGLSAIIDHGKNGFLFPAGDAQALAEILVRLSRDRGLIEKIVAGITPPSRVEEYVDEILRLYASTADDWPNRKERKAMLEEAVND